ncbi:MAG TPA: AMP-binding protein, partial [Solirubrobacteraceae bacterium]|nr:AMP-binding protein [Solirubrobacteraceae bacterium]
MEAGTVGTPSATGSTTMADLAALAAASHGSAPALKRRLGEQWVDTSYSELGETVSEVARGLIDLGIGRGDRVAILAHTRPEWTYANLGILAAGAASVSIYQTNSPEECHYVLEHSESTAVFAEDEEQLAKIRAIRHQLPSLQHVIVMDGDTSDSAISLDDVRERG